MQIAIILHGLFQVVHTILGQGAVIDDRRLADVAQDARKALLPLDGICLGEAIDA